MLALRRAPYARNLSAVLLSGADQHGSEVRVVPEPKDAAAVRVFPPGVPLATILLGVGLNWLWPIDLGFGFAIPRPERYWLGGVIVAGAFLGLGLWSVALFRQGGQNVNPWKPTERIETPRLVLRKPHAADAEAVFSRYSADPEVTRFLGWRTHRSVEDTRAFLEFSDSEWQQWPGGPYLIESRAVLVA